MNKSQHKHTCRVFSRIISLLFPFRKSGEVFNIIVFCGFLYFRIRENVAMETNEAQPQYRLATHANASMRLLDLEGYF